MASPASGKSTIAVMPWATSELMSEMAFWVLPSPFVYEYLVTLGHCAATVTAEYRVSSRQVLSPNPSARAIDAFWGPHHGYLLDTALVWPLAELPLLLPLLPLLLLLHAAAASGQPRADRGGADDGMAPGEFWSLVLAGGLLLMLLTPRCVRFVASSAEGVGWEGYLACLSGQAAVNGTGRPDAA